MEEDDTFRVPATINMNLHVLSEESVSPSPSPASSAFVSALQSPYISPRATSLSCISYTPPSDPYEFSSSASDSMPMPMPMPPRISFSFPRIPKLRTCDVYLAFHGSSPELARFSRWLKSDIELHGIACFLSSSGSSSSSSSYHDIICSVAFGVLVLTPSSLSSRAALDEIAFFSHKKNLIPILFDFHFDFHIDSLDCLRRCHSQFNLRADSANCNWRHCAARAALILRDKLGRKSAAAAIDSLQHAEELPYRRNKSFVGREAEIAEMEAALFGGSCSAVCIQGAAGIGKTEVALEFGYRHRQRYKAVIWVGGEGRFLRQNMVKNVWERVGVDVSAADGIGEMRSSSIRSLEEQEEDCLKRVRRALFGRDMPYLLIVDNVDCDELQHHFIPNKSTGPTHLIITSRISVSLNNLPVLHLRLTPLPFHDAMLLLTNRTTRTRREYPQSECEFLKKIDQKLGSLTFGLCLVSSLLSELSIAPSALFQAVDQLRIDYDDHCDRDRDADGDDHTFLTKLLSFCFLAVLHPNNSLAARMAAVGAWLAPSPVSATLLGAAAENLSSRNHSWVKDILRGGVVGRGCFSALNWNWNSSKKEESALLLVKLGLARRANNKRGECCIQLHPITQEFGKRSRLGKQGAKAAVEAVRKMGGSSEHAWATAFLVFGFKSEEPVVQLKAAEMVGYIRRTAVPLAMRAFGTFSRCSTAVELLKVCTEVLEEVEKTFVSQIEAASGGGSLSLSLCWTMKKKKRWTVDEWVWQEVTLLKATLLETRGKLVMRGGHFDSAEELCRTCISIRTVMLGHNHALTLSAQDTLAKLVRIRTKMF